MATDDKYEPRVAIILKVGVLSIATLAATHAALVTYFDAIAHAEEHRKYGEVKPEQLMNLREDERARLTAGPVSIERAMQQVAARGRMDASAEIAPRGSKDVAPLQGWTQMPSIVPPAMLMPEPAPQEATADAAAATDSAAVQAIQKTHPDGGAAAKPPAKRP